MMELAMQQPISFLTTAGCLATLVAYHTATEKAWSVDIRTECITWGLLALGRWLQRQTIGKQAGLGEAKSAPGSSGSGILKMDMSPWNRMMWALSICIATARIIPLYYDVASALPLATVAVFLYSYRESRTTSVLPGPGSNAPLSSITKEPNKRRTQLIRTTAFLLLGIWCCTLLQTDFNIYSYHDGEKGFYSVVFAAFVMLRMAAFVLLDTACKDRDLSSANNQNAFFETADAIVFRVFGIVTGIMVAFPPGVNLAWPVLLQASCNIASLVVNFNLVILGGVVPATTIDTYSIATIRTLFAKFTTSALSFFIAAIVSLAHAVLSIPPSSYASSLAARRRLLLPLTLIPILSLYFSRSAPAHPEFHLPQSIHPIEHLAATSEARFNETVSRQSQTLEDACAEYQRRYERRPPPNFDKWFHAAKRANFVLIDEFDTMMAALEPLWGVPAADIRGRVENALDTGQMSMIRFAIADHVLSYSMENFADWMAAQLYGWFDREILDTLPDMVFAINTRDEPKVVVPHDVLANALSHRSRTVGSENAAAVSQRHIENAKPLAVSHDGDDRLPLSQRVNFLEVGKQNAWDAMSVSCPIDSPARDFEHVTSPSLATLSSFGFLSNVSMSKDICQYPQLRDLHGMLLSPASLSMTHSLVPIFSQSKISSFQDLLYPSPWYAAKLDMLEYMEDEDVDWDQKENVAYWTGSTTGGHSTMDNWHHFQRQRLTLMAMDHSRPVNLMRKKLTPRHGHKYDVAWEPINGTIREITPSLRVRISAVIQCDSDACEHQQSALGVEPDSRDDVSASYQTRYNLDLDGNGFSGRFYRLLRSKSAVLKQTLYREWHDDWLVPWVHYIPINIDLTDFPETIRYLTQEPDGQALGKKVAENSREWAGKVLRKQDMVLVFWRLLLEYGRILNDEREQMFFTCSPL